MNATVRKVFYFFFPIIYIPGGKERSLIVPLPMRMPVAVNISCGWGRGVLLAVAGISEGTV